MAARPPQEPFPSARLPTPPLSRLRHPPAFLHAQRDDSSSDSPSRSAHEAAAAMQGFAAAAAAAAAAAGAATNTTATSAAPSNASATPSATHTAPPPPADALPSTDQTSFPHTTPHAVDHRQPPSRDLAPIPPPPLVPASAPLSASVAFPDRFTDKPGPTTHHPVHLRHSHKPAPSALPALPLPHLPQALHPLRSLQQSRQPLHPGHPAPHAALELPHQQDHTHMYPSHAVRPTYTAAPMVRDQAGAPSPSPVVMGAAPGPAAPIHPHAQSHSSQHRLPLPHALPHPQPLHPPPYATDARYQPPPHPPHPPQPPPPQPYVAMPFMHNPVPMMAPATSPNAALFDSEGAWLHNMIFEYQRMNQTLREALNAARSDIEKLKTEIAQFESEKEAAEAATSAAPSPSAVTAASPSASAASKQTRRYWTAEEHNRFLEAVRTFGQKDVRAIANFVGTRNPSQVRTHAQKYYLKVARQAERKSGIGRRSMSEGDLLRVGASGVAGGGAGTNPEAQAQGCEDAPPGEGET